MERKMRKKMERKMSKKMERKMSKRMINSTCCKKKLNVETV